jgi:hypothetical protein
MLGTVIDDVLLVDKHHPESFNHVEPNKTKQNL